MLQKPVKYAILVRHGVDPFSCPETSANAQDTEESASCALSTKTKPDSRGLDPAIQETAAIGRANWIAGSSLVKPGDDT
jgi:hypothetical protein